MLLRTHLVLTIFVALLFIEHVNNALLFIFVALAATLLPDIDTGFSAVGKYRGFRFMQLFVRHRGIIHSFTFCIFISVLLAFFIPKISLAFFLGYGLHLFADSFTKEGIMPFWPYRKQSTGPLRTGSLFETTMFVLFLLVDIVLAAFTLF